MLTERPGRTGPAAGFSDADLIGRSRREPECFAAIFDRHADEILHYAHARLGPDLAQDVTAETFLAAFRHRDRYDITRPDARPWLYGIAVRQIGRHRRAAARRLALLRSLPADLATEDFGGRAADRVTAEQLSSSKPASRRRPTGDIRSTPCGTRSAPRASLQSAGRACGQAASR